MRVYELKGRADRREACRVDEAGMPAGEAVVDVGGYDQGQAGHIKPGCLLRVTTHREHGIRLVQHTEEYGIVRSDSVPEYR
jgi:hypothetical protein